MTYLTHDDMEALRADELRISKGVLNVSDFTDTSDRTLTVGYSNHSDCPAERVYEHIYIEGGQLRRHSYILQNKKVLTQAQTAYEGIHVLLLSPKDGVAPSATDCEFARLMALFNQPLHFLEYGSPEDLELSIPVDGKFLGMRQQYYFVNGNSQLV